MIGRASFKHETKYKTPNSMTMIKTATAA